MEFDNSFEVPLPVDEAWKLLMDIKRIAPCLPGAELTEVVDDRTYKGKVGVRLGPVSLAFAGTVKFDEIDDAAHRARISAQGSDAKGRGAANATATFHLEPVPGGAKVLVHTNLTLSGAVAQYGRGVGIIQMTAAQIITQFANNLKAQFATAPAAPAAAVTSAAVPTPAPSSTASAPATPTAAGPASSSPPAAAKPISGFALAGAVFVAWIKRLFGRE
jgi:carbon monoxide dehydrogenase subunit G